jgi:hypothetical protein
LQRQAKKRLRIARDCFVLFLVVTGMVPSGAGG